MLNLGFRSVKQIFDTIVKKKIQDFGSHKGKFMILILIVLECVYYKIDVFLFHKN